MFDHSPCMWLKFSYICVVTMQAQKEAPLDMKCNDKYVLQSAVVTPGNAAKDITRELVIN